MVSFVLLLFWVKILFWLLMMMLCGLYLMLLVMIGSLCDWFLIKDSGKFLVLDGSIISWVLLLILFMLVV